MLRAGSVGSARGPFVSQRGGTHGRGQKPRAALQSSRGFAFLWEAAKGARRQNHHRAVTGRHPAIGPVRKNHNERFQGIV
jgi:hypothetical protein